MAVALLPPKTEPLIDDDKFTTLNWLIFFSQLASGEISGVSTFARSLLDDTSAAAMRTTLGLNGARTLLDSQLFSGATFLNFTTGFSSDYDTYEFEIYNASSSISASLNAQFSINGGTSYDSGGNYKARGISSWTEGNIELALGNAGTSAYIGVDMADSAAYGNSGKFTIRTPGSVDGNSVNTEWQAEITRTDSGGSINLSKIHGFYVGAAGSRVNAVKFMSPSGATWRGIIRMYGIRNS